MLQIFLIDNQSLLTTDKATVTMVASSDENMFK